MLPLKAPDDVRAPLEAEKRVYENALALARGETPAPDNRAEALAAGFAVDPIGNGYRVRFPSGALTRGGFEVEADAWASAARSARDLAAGEPEPPFLIR